MMLAPAKIAAIYGAGEVKFGATAIVAITASARAPEAPIARIVNLRTVAPWLGGPPSINSQIAACNAGLLSQRPIRKAPVSAIVWRALNRSRKLRVTRGG